MAYDPYNPNMPLQNPMSAFAGRGGIGSMVARALGGAQQARYGPMREYARAAEAAQRAAQAQAFDAIGKAHGEELAGTPGFLAGQSMAGPGSLARLRGRNLRSGVSRLASGVYDISADAARGQRDFTGGILMKREEERIQKEREKRAKKGGGLGGALKRLGGAAVGFATGGPAGAAAGLLGTQIPGAAQAPTQTSDEERYLAYLRKAGVVD